MDMEMEIYHQRMEAVKRVYADVILNTGKEAAARVMASERRALRAEKDLASSKEESLVMILRLKQLMDVKTKESEEAQIKLSCQQRTIEELEAQLNEAEQITVDLRSELQQAHQNLDKANHKQLLNEELLKVLYKQRTREIEIASDLGSVNASDRRHDELSSRNVERVDHMLEPETMRNRTPEKYKNNCTQRIRALEMSPLKNQPLVAEDEEENDEGISISTHLKNQSADTIKANTENTTEHTSKIICNSPLSKAIRRRKRKFRFGTPRRFTAESCAPQFITNSNEAVNITTGSNKENLQHAAEGYEVEHEDDEYGKRRMKSIDTLTPSLKSPPYPLNETYLRSSLLARCNGNHSEKCGEEIRIQHGGNTKLALTVSSSSEAEGDSLLKNTNKRKRKKVTFDFPVETKSVKKRRPSKRRVVEKKPVRVASDRESSQLLQVAHQLVSLSHWRK